VLLGFLLVELDVMMYGCFLLYWVGHGLLFHEMVSVVDKWSWDGSCIWISY
jgi:hypothetical protein